VRDGVAGGVTDEEEVGGSDGSVGAVWADLDCSGQRWLEGEGEEERTGTAGSRRTGRRAVRRNGDTCIIIRCGQASAVGRRHKGVGKEVPYETWFLASSRRQICRNSAVPTDS
jgi:hypothetical protein